MADLSLFFREMAILKKWIFLLVAILIIDDTTRGGEYGTVSLKDT
jgi:hypothetical protein